MAGRNEVAEPCNESKKGVLPLRLGAFARELFSDRGLLSQSHQRKRLHQRGQTKDGMMDNPNDLLELVDELGPAIGVMAVVLGTLIAGWFQSKVARRQVQQAHESQLALLEQTHRHNLEVLTAQQRRDEDLRLRQFAESDRADRLVVIEYIDLLLPRLCEVASIEYLASDNKEADELRRYLTLQRYMSANVVDPAHPERNLGLRMAFLLFQLAAMRIALNARWLRPLTGEQSRFLSHWETHIEPMICSGRYPGKELLFREQIEIITEEMLVAPQATKVTRPLNWKEFCDKYSGTPAVRDLAEMVAAKLRFIFDEGNKLPPRKAMQCRLAIMALYLIQLSKEAGENGWTRREEGLWDIVTRWFAWEDEQGQEPAWYVFQFGDVAQRARVNGLAA
jgi:hypothetical protein